MRDETGIVMCLFIGIQNLKKVLSLILGGNPHQIHFTMWGQ